VYTLHDFVLKKVNTNWLKTTYTGLLLDCFAVCPLGWKKGLVSGLVSRAYGISCDWQTFHLEIEKIKSIFHNNGYPQILLDVLVGKFINSKLVGKSEKSSKEKYYTFKLPYIGQQSVVLKKRLVRIFKQCDVEINCVFTSFKVGSYFSLKDKTDSVLDASLVYEFQCSNDSSTNYIGKTKRYLQQRVREHLTGRSAIYDHISHCVHCQDPSVKHCFKKLYRASNDVDLSICEA